MHACAGYTALGMALALSEGGVVHACDISPQYPAVGAPILCTPPPSLREDMLQLLFELLPIVHVYCAPRPIANLAVATPMRASRV